MKFDVGIFFLGDLQGVWRLGQKHIPAFLVLGEVHRLPCLEIIQLRLVGAGDPSGLIKRDRLVTAGGVVLMQETVLNHLKLEFAYGADDLATSHLASEELGHALVGELLQTFG